MTLKIIFKYILLIIQLSDFFRYIFLVKPHIFLVKQKSLNVIKITARKKDFNDYQKKIGKYSDRGCLAFGIKPIMPTKESGKTLVYNEWEHKCKGTSWENKIHLEFDCLIAAVENLDELLNKFKSMWYTVKRGKYISVKAPGQRRFVRTKILCSFARIFLFSIPYFTFLHFLFMFGGCYTSVQQPPLFLSLFVFLVQFKMTPWFILCSLTF